MPSNIRYVVVMINNVELAFGSSNIIDHNHNISNVGLHLVQQVYSVRAAPYSVTSNDE